MSARLFHLWCLPDQQRAVAGPQDSGTPSLVFFEQNTYRLRLHALVQNDAASSLTRFLPGTFSGFTSFEAALGLLDAKPESGKWKMRVVGEVEQTAVLDFDISTEALAAALNALAAVGEDGVEVTAGNASNIYIIRPTDPDNDLTFEVSEIDLTPLCISRVRKGTDGAGSYSMVKLVKAYLAFADADAWEYPTPPPPTISMGRIGDVTKNCIQYLAIPAGAVGSFSFTHSGIDTTLVEVGADASTIAAALNALFADGASSPRFRVLKSTSAFQIECIGPLAKLAVPLLGLTLFGQEPLDTPEADFQLTELPLELTVAAKEGVNLVFELVGIDADGNEWTLIRDTRATVLNTLIDRTTSAAIGAIATHYDTVYVSVDETAPILIGQRSATVAVPGEGTETVAGTYVVNFEHGLGTRTPGIEIYELLNVSPEKWKRLPDNEYDARNDGDPNVEIITFAYSPPAEGEVGSLKIYATNWDAQVWSNDHEHPWTQIFRDNGDDTKTYLPAIIAALEAAMPDGWPSIPGSQIEDGSITADKLDLASLALALRESADFLTTLRTLISDSTLIGLIGDGLAANSAFVTTIANALVSNTAFTEAVRTLFLDLLQGTAPRDSILIRIPDLDAAFPALLADKSFAALPAIQNSPTDGGSLTGYAPRAASGNAGTYRTVVTVAHLAPHRRKTFADGDVLFSDGFDWWRATVDGVEYYAAEFDRQLFALAVNDTMLALGTRFSLAFAFTASLSGNCTGYYLFELKRGTANTAGGGPVNLSTVTWDETVISAPIHLTDAATTHNFAYTATRSADDELSATKASYLGAAEAADEPENPRFVMFAQLTHFDVSDVTKPVGQVKLVMKAASASIVKI